MKRRDLFRLMAATGASLTLPPLRLMAATHRDVLDGHRLYDHVVQYTQIGEHRTGTTGDRLTAEWIRCEFDGYGLETAFHPVSMNLFEVTSKFLEIDHERHRADPEWYPTPTPAAGIRAPMRVLEEGEDLSVLKDKIWVVEVQMTRPVVPREIKARAVEGAKGRGRGGQLRPGDEPRPAPVEGTARLPAADPRDPRRTA